MSRLTAEYDEKITQYEKRLEKALSDKVLLRFSTNKYFLYNLGLHLHRNFNLHVLSDFESKLLSFLVIAFSISLFGEANPVSKGALVTECLLAIETR